MRLIVFVLALVGSSISHAVVDTAPKCSTYFETHQTDGNYQLMKNGLTQDPLTGLTWFRCSAGQIWEDGQCKGSPILLSYTSAQDFAKSLKLAGFDDWRVPKIAEMSSLVHEECKSPAINTRVFLGIEPEVYWSSETNFWIRPMAWSLYFYSGHYFSRQAKVDSFRLMLVRN